MIVLNFLMVLISSLGFGNRHVISNLRSCSWIWHGLSVPGSCWVIFLYLFISLDAYVFVEVYKHCIWRLFKMFSLFSMQNFHTYIYGVYFFFSKQNLMNFWLCDFNKLFSLLPKTLLWFTLLFFHLFSIYSFLSLLLRNGLHTWQNYMEYQILKTLLVIYQIINFMQNRDVIFFFGVTVKF